LVKTLVYTDADVLLVFPQELL